MKFIKCAQSIFQLSLAVFKLKKKVIKKGRNYALCNKWSLGKQLVNNLAEENITFIIIQLVKVLHRLAIRNIGLCNLQDSNPVLW